jgi:macrolide-specific efflux system membrane fusion protein
VRKGQTLATVGTAALQASKDAARASVTAAQESVAEASSSTAQTAAQSSLVAARSQLKSATTALADARLRSTITGTVTSVDLSKGESVSGTAATGDDSSASDSSGSDSQVVVQSSKRFIVNASVDDTEVKSVKKGQAVAVTPDGATSSVPGVVRSVGAIPSSSSSVVSFPVVVRLTGHPSGIYSGASATVVMTTKHTSNVLEIPTFAIINNGSTATVQVQNGSSTSTRTISVGTSYGLETQVLSGLKAGEKVVVTLPSFSGRAPTSTGSGNGGGLGEFGGTGSGGGFPSGGTGGFSGGPPGGQG